MIRPMTDADAQAAADLAASSMKQPWSAKAFLSELRNPQAYLIVSADDETGALNGYLGMQLTPDDAELTGIAVEKHCRRTGIAGKMLSRARSDLKKNGISRIVLEVRASNAPAISFYETQGFSRIGVRRGFYDAPKEDALVMTDDQE